MSTGKSPAVPADDEIPLLIQRLIDTEQRLVELTHGQVDTVTGADGRTFSLRRAQEQLRDSEVLKQAAILNALPAKIALLDSEGVILTVNDAWRHAKGTHLLQNSDHLVGQNYLLRCDEATNPSKTGEVATGIREVLSGKEKQFSIEYLCGSAKEKHWFLLTVSPLADDGHNGVIVMHQDITKRKLDDDTLRESEERFSNAFEHAPIGVALVSPEGKWTKVNKALQDLLGFTSAELLTRTFRDITHPDDFELDVDNARKMLAGEIASYQVEKRFIHAHGHMVSVLLNVSLVRNNQKAPHYFIVQIQDITERINSEARLRHSEIQLRQSQKMDAIGQLAGGVAHDFNNLLTVIMGRSELLLTRSELSAAVIKNIKLIHHTAGRAAVLTRQLLQFSRQQVLQPQIIDLSALIASTEELLRRLIPEDISLIFKFNSKAGFVKADPGQIEQVIMNLVINARDAMPRGGALTIETAIVDLDLEYCQNHEGAIPGSHVMMAVGDTGCGITEETRAKIFEPFFTTKALGKGTGLGLSTVYGIVKQAEGSIYVYSELDHGSVFKVYLPSVQQRAKPTITNTALAQVKGGGETILLVEDETGIRDLLTEILTALGYHVIQANDGEDALLRSHDHTAKIDLLLTDVVMPKLNGKELALRVLKDRPTIKIIFMSGYTSEAIVNRGVLDEGIEFLEKPFTPTSVAKRVREVLDKPSEKE